MARLRKEDAPSSIKPLRIIASGTLFLTHTLAVPCHPAPSTVIRAHSVTKTRGGSASSILSLLAHLPGAVDPILVASLGGNDEGQILVKELESEGVNTRYCKVWPDSGVPSAWVIQATENDTKTVVNHNPLPDITHEEFVSLLGPLLVPENYMFSSPSTPSPLNATFVPSSTPLQPSPNGLSYSTPAPFDWVHFEGRSVKTTLSNIIGLESLAQERKWRNHCVFSVDVGRRSRQGIEALIPHADVLFLNKHYAQMHSSNYATTPRAFLLSLMSIAPPHALLIAHWGTEGAAALSLPTKEYFQSSGWVEERPAPSRGRSRDEGNHLRPDTAPTLPPSHDVRSVRTGSDFWAGRTHTPSSSEFTARDITASMSHNSGYLSTSGASELGVRSRSKVRSRSPGVTSPDPSATTSGYDQSAVGEEEEEDNDSQETEVPEDVDDGVVDEVGAQDAFVAGMIYALSRRIVPGPPFTPSYRGDAADTTPHENEKGRWRLDECLRFATELAGRKARRRNWVGLTDEMTRAGWFNA